MAPPIHSSFDQLFSFCMNTIQTQSLLSPFTVSFSFFFFFQFPFWLYYYYFFIFKFWSAIKTCLAINFRSSNRTVIIQSQRALTSSFPVFFCSFLFWKVSVFGNCINLWCDCVCVVAVTALKFCRFRFTT